MQLGKKLNQLRQRGDTIVEVMIAIAVISMVLGGAYVTTNRSLQATRSAQERSGALKLVESQIEQLKALANTNPQTVFATSSTFCMYNNAVTDPSTNNCTLNLSGSPTTVEPKFQMAITRDNNDFTVRSTWFDVSGDRTAEVKLTYRAYQ